MLPYKANIDIISFCIYIYHMKNGNSTDFSQIIGGGFFEAVWFKRIQNNQNIISNNLEKI